MRASNSLHYRGIAHLPSSRGELGRMETALLVLSLCGSGHSNLAPHVDYVAKRWDIPAEVLVSMIFVESSCHPNAIGPKGTVGLMQIAPGTRAAMGHSVKELRNSRLNLFLGARHLRYWLNRCGDLPGALGVYNGAKTCPDGRESDYTKRVLNNTHENS
jgi:soluble lytic murein transglycosylase-like protein